MGGGPTVTWQPPSLDQPCSRHFTWRALIGCGSTYERLSQQGIPIAPPAEAESWRMLRGLASAVLDPLVDKFGAIHITYGFAAQTLTRHINKSIAPKLDQHAACEVDRRGKPICARAGAAVDLQVPHRSSLDVVAWLTAGLPVDRLYYYGENRPIHVSWHPAPASSFWVMVTGPAGHLVPRRLGNVGRTF